MGVYRSCLRYKCWEGIDRRAHADFDTKPHITPSEQTQRFPYFIRKWHADFWSDVRDSVCPPEGEITSVASVVRWGHYYEGVSVNGWRDGTTIGITIFFHGSLPALLGLPEL